MRNLALWLMQGLLALVFLASGSLKLLLTREALGAKLAWVASAPTWLPPVIGVLEVLGALGLMLPFALQIVPELTPLAAALLALLMMLAAGLHLARAEPALALPAAVLCGLCVFVSIGRRN